mmetsp:Transcript_37520/g.42556  ORF Transcript_37520/g.42556 Transcript_37520/m.42556 type:complete len:116 (+) Transcript_37520:717-1064(+)
MFTDFCLPDSPSVSLRFWFHLSKVSETRLETEWNSFNLLVQESSLIVMFLPLRLFDILLRLLDHQPLQSTWKIDPEARNNLLLDGWFNNISVRKGVDEPILSVVHEMMEKKTKLQ